MTRILFILAIFMLSAASFAQNDANTYPYAADRPGISNAPYLVGLHQLAIESGVGLNSTEGPQTSTYYNQNIFRYGMFKHLEFRAEVDFAYTSNKDTSFYGVRTIGVGLKVPIITGKKHLPDIAILGSSFLPKIGNPLYSPSNYIPTATILIQKSFSNLSIGCNLGVFWDNQSENGYIINPYSTGCYAQGSYTANISYAVKKTNIFVESYGFYSNKTNPYFAGDIGVAYAVSSELQLDLSIGNNIQFNNSFIVGGIAWRIPNKNR